MSKVYYKKRRMKLDQKRKNKEKTRKLLVKYFSAKSDSEKQKIREKLLKLKPHLNIDEYISFMKDKIKIS